ncbi:HAD family hydrolase [Bacillus licheniformis]|nr:HAD family hydrolase [Bacillus licheniformis]
MLAVGLLLFLPHFCLAGAGARHLQSDGVHGRRFAVRPCRFNHACRAVADINGARNGLLVKGSVFLEKLGNSKIVALDKTGTITNGKPGVEDMLLAADIEERECLEAAAAIEKQSGHPLAKAIVEYAEAKASSRPRMCRLRRRQGLAFRLDTMERHG